MLNNKNLPFDFGLDLSLSLLPSFKLSSSPSFSLVFLSKFGWISICIFSCQSSSILVLYSSYGGYLPSLARFHLFFSSIFPKMAFWKSSFWNWQRALPSEAAVAAFEFLAALAACLGSGRCPLMQRPLLWNFGQRSLPLRRWSLPFAEANFFFLEFWAAVVAT